MSASEHEHDTEGTGHAGEDADEALHALSQPDQDEMTHHDGDTNESTEGEENGVRGMFGGLTPTEAVQRRWERERNRPSHDPSDPRVSMAAALFRKAEKGDTRAYEAWRQVTDDIERDRLARDGADGPRAWEQIDPSHRRALLALLQGGDLHREEDGAWRITPVRADEEAVQAP